MNNSIENVLLRVLKKLPEATLRSVGSGAAKANYISTTQLLLILTSLCVPITMRLNSSNMFFRIWKCTYFNVNLVIIFVYFSFLFVLSCWILKFFIEILRATNFDQNIFSQQVHLSVSFNEKCFPKLRHFFGIQFYSSVFLTSLVVW